MHVIEAFWQFSRPKTLIIIWLHMILFYIVVSYSISDVMEIICAFIIMTMVYVNAVALNDLSDIKVDKLNLLGTEEIKERPIINNTVTSSQVYLIIICSAFISIFLSVFIQPWLIWVIASSIVANVIYSLSPVQVSKRGIAAQLLLPLCYVVMPFVVAVALTEKVSSLQVTILIGMYILFVGRLFLKDVRDEKGDRKVGKKTYLVRYGMKRTLSQSSIWTVLGISITAIALTFNYQYTAIMLGVAIIAAWGFIWACRHCYQERSLQNQLTHVAIAGRFASMWLFCVVLWLCLVNANVPLTSNIFLMLVSVGIFMAGIVMLKEEQSFTNKQIETKLQQ